MTPVLYVVIPCYNEEEVLPETSKRILAKLGRMIDQGKVRDESRIIFVDDGSKDKTWSMIESYHTQNNHFGGIKLAHNKGHQYALLAGLMTVKDRCDCTISMDADLQDDIEVLDEFVDRYKEGCEVVYGVRKARTSDTAFKRGTAEGYYKFLEKLGVDIVYNHADYRLLGKRAMDILAKYKESNLFLRGIVPDIGFKSAVVYYERAERFAGESKYPLKKMLQLAMDGVTSFSIKPLELILKVGMAIFVISVLALVYSLVGGICGVPYSGVIALVASIWLLGGILLQAMGMVGIYIGKTYREVKDRPRFVVETFLSDETATPDGSKKE